MKRVLKRSPKHNQIRKSKAKTAERRDKAATASPAGKARLDYAIMRNAHDQIAIDMLRSSPVGGLAVDRFLRNDPQMLPAFREALVDVYFRAAKVREFRR